MVFYRNAQPIHASRYRQMIMNQLRVPKAVGRLKSRLAAFSWKRNPKRAAFRRVIGRSVRTVRKRRFKLREARSRGISNLMSGRSYGSPQRFGIRSKRVPTKNSIFDAFR
jgi:hypothetical protein